MLIKLAKKNRARKRHQRIRTKILGTGARPRLAIHQSNKHIYAQLIDDISSITLTSCSTLQKEIKGKLQKTWNKEAAKLVGELIAKNAIAKGVKAIVFDRGGYKYHGKVKEIADSARKVGLKF